MLDGNSIKLAIDFETVYFWDDLKKCFAEIEKTMGLGGQFVVVNFPGDIENIEKMISIKNIQNVL